jgi:hypothetical protein
VITDGTNLAFTATGLVSIVASQAGSEFHEPAPSLTNTYVVLPADKQAQTITGFVPVDGSEFAGTYKVRLVARASSLLPVSFSVGSGPGLITGGTNLVFTDTGLVSIVASQAGSEFYEAAPSLTNTYTVIYTEKAAQTIDHFLPSDGSSFSGMHRVGLSAQASSLLPVSFTVGSGPGRITGETNLAFTATGQVSIVASQAGSVFYEAASSVTHTFAVTEPVRGVFNDYNGDGRSDLAVFGKIAGVWYILSVDGEPIVWAGAWGWPEALTVPGDYNRDGYADLAVFNVDNGAWYVLSASGNRVLWDVKWGWPGALPVSGDYDGDGRSDLAVFDNNSGLWFILSPTGELILWGGAWGWPGAVPVTGDYNGDGRSDLAVFDTTSGRWYIVSVTGELIAWNVQFGWDGAIAVPGDYDGDGVSDLAVFNEVTGGWYILSLSGEVIAWDVRWGGPGTVPVPGDYDGDGVYDLAVYDNANGGWYILSMTGEVIAWNLMWGWDGAVPVGGAL